MKMSIFRQRSNRFSFHKDGAVSFRASSSGAIGGFGNIFQWALLVCGAAVACVQAQFAGGDGSSADPFQITNWTELNEVRNHIGPVNDSLCFVLMNDIDSSTDGYDSLVRRGDSLCNDGKGWAPIGLQSNYGLAGVFDGNGHFIDDVVITLKDPLYAGLFGAVGKTGVVKNLHVRRCGITADYYSGGIVGHNQGTISNSSAGGTLIGDSNVGGLVGYNSKGLIVHCCSDAYIEVDGQWSGGLVGFNSDSGRIYDCFSVSSVIGKASTGGLVGYNAGDIERCYAAGGVSGDVYKGGLVGYDNAGSYRDCYWRGDSNSVIGSKGTAVAGIAGVTAAQLHMRQTFESWDFDSVWNIVEGGDTVSYPFLRGIPGMEVPGVTGAVPRGAFVDEGNNSPLIFPGCARRVALTKWHSPARATGALWFDIAGRVMVSGRTITGCHGRTMSRGVYVEKMGNHSQN